MIAVCNTLSKAAPLDEPGDTDEGTAEVTRVSDNTNVVGALLGDGLAPTLKLGVGDEDANAADEGEGKAVEVAPRATAARASDDESWLPVTCL